MKLFQVLHDGPSRPIIETPTGRWLSLSEFNDGRWASYDREELDCQVIVETLNFILANTPELIANWEYAELDELRDTSEGR